MQLKLYNLYSFFSQLDFSRGIFVLFLLNKGMTNVEIGILQTALFYSNMLAEIPAGLAADKYKRKYSVAFGLVLIAVAATGYIYFDRFLVFLFIFILHGAGFAFQSGADSALLYDTLKAEKKENKHVSILSKTRTLGTLALALAIYLGGELKNFSWDYVYIFFAASMIIASITILAMKEVRSKTSENTDGKEEVEEKVSIWQSLKNFSRIKEGKSLLMFILGMSFIEMCAAPIFIYIQKYLSDQSMSTSHIALVIGVSQLFTAASYMLTKYLEGLKLSKLIIFGSILLSLLIFPLLFTLPLAISVVLFLLIEAVPNLIFVFTDNHINEGVPSHIRASFLSVQSFITSIFIGFGFLGCGFLMDKFSSSVVLGLMGIFPLIGLIILIPYLKKIDRNKLC